MIVAVLALVLASVQPAEPADNPVKEVLDALSASIDSSIDGWELRIETGTRDFETLRAEAHALRGTSGVVGLQRLAELAGLMESDLAEAAKNRDLRPNRADQISDAAKALAEGAAAAADGKDEPPDVGRSLAQLFSA